MTNEVKIKCICFRLYKRLLPAALMSTNKTHAAKAARILAFSALLVLLDIAVAASFMLEFMSFASCNSCCLANTKAEYKRRSFTTFLLDDFL
jgi:hypothetical protein